MYKKEKKKAKFGIGYINDEYVLSHLSDFDYENSELEKEMALPAWSNVHDGKTLYEYQGHLMTLNELRIRFLSKYYGIK